MRYYLLIRSFVGSTVSFGFLSCVILTVLLGNASDVMADYATEVLNDNPIAYWRFEDLPSASGVMLDSSGNGNHGNYFGNPLAGTGAGIGTGTSMNLDGNDFAEAVVTITQSFSAEVWVQSLPNAWNKNGWFASSRENNGFILHPDANGTTVRGFVYDNVGSFHGMSGVDASPIDQYHHYVLTYDAGTDTAVFYLDGQAEETVVGLLGTRVRSITDDITVTLGKDQFSADRVGLGQMDEMAIYGTALSAGRVQAHYNAATIPEPASGAVLALTGLSSLLFRRRRSAFVRQVSSGT